MITSFPWFSGPGLIKLPSLFHRKNRSISHLFFRELETEMSDLTTMMTIDELWSKATDCYRASLKTDTERSQMERYFPMFISHEMEGSEFRVGVEQELQVEWFTPLYAKPLANAIRVVGGPSDVVVRFIVAHPAATAPGSAAASVSEPGLSRSAAASASEP